jgi:hypothetical protein
MINSCRKFVWMKIRYWKFEGNLNTHVPLWAQQHMVDRHYFLNLKPWSARTLYVYAHADLAQKYFVGLQEIFVSRCAPRKKILFSYPKLTSVCFSKLHENPYYYLYKLNQFYHITPIYHIINNNYYMAFQNSLFWLVDKRSVKTHIQTVVRIFRIWNGVPDVVYLAGNFCFANRKSFCFLIFQLCVIKIYR